MFCNLYDCVPYMLLIQAHGCQNSTNMICLLFVVNHRHQLTLATCNFCSVPCNSLNCDSVTLNTSTNYSFIQSIIHHHHHQWAAGSTACVVSLEVVVATDAAADHTHSVDVITLSCRVALASQLTTHCCITVINILIHSLIHSSAARFTKDLKKKVVITSKFKMSVIILR